MTAREFDVVVWGATGFTGALVAEYLLARYGDDAEFRWAIAGRDGNRLAALRESLGAGAEALPSIVADSFDRASLDALAARTRVVLTTVGPYARYGSELVAACVGAGTHYCDLAGEAQWIRRMIDAHHESAVAAGARIVHACGFDSVPMDLGVWFLQREAERRFGRPCRAITMLVKATKGGVSGGTLASMLNLIEESRADREVARTLVDPYGLNPRGERDGPDQRDQQDVRYDDTAGVWTAPFVMAGINTKIVRRSNALLGYPWGRDFRYREAVMTGKGLGGRLRGTALALGLGGFVLGASLAPTRALLKRFVLTKPGDGPDRDERESGFFDLRQFGVVDADTTLRGRVTGDRDPGYGSTSKMLAECAVCLARDPIDSGGGVTTPAAAMGDALLERLQTNAGLRFEILDSR